MILNIILATIAILIIAEGLLISIFSVQIKKAASQILKNTKRIRKFGLLELIIGIILLFISIIIRNTI